MRAVLFALALSSGCGFTTNGGSTGGVDARTDAVPVDGCTTFSRQLDTCTSPSGMDLSLQGVLELDTDAGTLVDDNDTMLPLTTMPVMTTTNNVAVLAVFVGNLTFGGTTRLRVVGSKPLAIISHGTVTLSAGAVIDLSAGGAGARAACTDNAAPGANDNGGASGGGGGGFGAAGGRGGNGDSDGGQSTGGAGGSPVALPTGPLGGCPGAQGGRGGDPGGAGSLGGGAIYIAAATKIDIAATAGINAGGGGGAGGTRTGGSFGDAGGGGGGSGGMILLESPLVRSAGILAANGGGGGEGSGDGDAGDAGTKATLSVDAASGGAGASPSGTDGGPGGTVTTPVGGSPVGVQQGGGGGGGGGVGFIHVDSADVQLGTLVSPAAT